MKVKRIDLIIMVLFPIFAAIISLVFKVNYLILCILFFGIPAVWYSIKIPHIAIKTALFSLVASVPIAIIMDYICTLNNSWIVSHSIFPFKLLGIVPIEDVIWLFLITDSILIFYEYFLNKHKIEKTISPKMKYLIIILSLFFCFFFITYLVNPNLMKVSYSYFWTSMVFFFLPTVIFLINFPKLLNKYVKIGIYYFFVILLMEIVGLELKHWVFTGDNFIGWVELFKYRFPLEEFFFLIIIGPFAALSYYELFDDDMA